MHTISYSPLNKTIHSSNSSDDLRVTTNNAKHTYTIDPIHTPEGSPVGAVFIIVNAALGAGLLSFPQAFVFAGGVLPGLVLEICLAVLMAVNLVVVAYATDISGASSYQQMIYKLFGSAAAVTVQVFIILYTFGSCVTYIVIIGDQFEKLFELLNASDPVLDRNKVPSLKNHLNEQWYFDRRLWTAGIAILAIFPLCLFRNIRFLNWPSLVGVTSCFYISIMTVAVFFMKNSKNGTVTEFDVSHDPRWSSINFLSALPIFCFGYQCHLATVPVYSELKKKSIPTFVLIAIAAICICFCVYSLTGLFGFLTFGIKVDADIIKTYDAKNYLVIIARVGLLISMITSFPLLAFLGRSALDEFVVQILKLLSHKLHDGISKLSADHGYTQLFRLQIISLCWFTLSLLLGVFLPSIQVIITPIGGVAAMFSIVFPGFLIVNFAIRMHTNKRSLWKQIPISVFGAVVVAIGSFIGGYSATQGVINLVTPSTN